MTLLSRLQADIDARVQAILENRPGWPCGKGCDSCCQQLAEVPQLTADECGPLCCFPGQETQRHNRSLPSLVPAWPA